MRRAATLIELLFVSLAITLASSLILTLVFSMGRVQQMTSTLPTLQSNATDTVNEIAATLRRAPLCDASAGCTGVTDSALSVASASTLTTYLTSAGSTRRYAVTGGVLQSFNGSTVTRTFGSGATLGFTYLLNTTAIYATTGDPSSMSWVSSVSTADLPRLMAVRITATFVSSGLTGTFTAEVRLRNSPKKALLTD